MQVQRQLKEPVKATTALFANEVFKLQRFICVSELHALVLLSESGFVFLFGLHILQLRLTGFAKAVFRKPQELLGLYHDNASLGRHTLQSGMVALRLQYVHLAERTADSQYA